MSKPRVTERDREIAAMFDCPHGCDTCGHHIAGDEETIADYREEVTGELADSYGVLLANERDLKRELHASLTALLSKFVDLPAARNYQDEIQHARAVIAKAEGRE